MEYQSENKILLISDYGRSGQGWLSYMLCYILNATFIEPYDFVHCEKYSSSEHILRLTGGNLPNRDRTEYFLVVKTHNYPPAELNLTDKIIFLTRDPRDVAVSAYYLHKGIVKKPEWGNLKGKLCFKFTTSIRFIDYFLTIMAWKNHYQAWQNIKYFHVKYEELSENAETALKNILEYLGVESEDKIIQEAVDNFSFEKITGRQRGQQDLNNVEFRSGIIGDYKNHFSKIELKLIGLFFKKNIQKAGYTW